MENNLPPKTVADIKAAREIVWLGVDFTRAKLIGPSGFTDAWDIIRSKYAAINDLFIQESHKFNFQKFLGKTARFNLNKVYERNMKISPEGLVLPYDIPNRIDSGVVQEVIDEYQLMPENAIGLIFIVESLNKLQESCFTWVTFIDLNTGKGILTSKFARRALGFGFRNYWANSFYNVLRDIRSILH